MSDVEPGHKRCHLCRIVKTVGEFPRDRRREQQCRSNCSRCHNAQQKDRLRARREGEP